MQTDNFKFKYFTFKKAGAMNKTAMKFPGSLTNTHNASMLEFKIGKTE